MQTENITNPGQSPADGDLIRATYPNGSVEQKQYWSPVAPPAPTRRSVIIARLSEIDTITDKPRTRRELQLNKVATREWLETLDAEADTLRAELAGL